MNHLTPPLQHINILSPTNSAENMGRKNKKIIEIRSFVLSLLVADEDSVH